MLFKDVTLRVTDVGPPIVLTDNKRVYKYQRVIPTHSCQTPRPLQVGDAVVVHKDPTLNKDILTKLALNQCGEECQFFFYDLISN